MQETYFLKNSNFVSSELESIDRPHGASICSKSLKDKTIHVFAWIQ